MNLRDRARSFLSRAGKSNQKVVAVFGLSPATSHAAVMHVREGAPEIPVWLYCTAQPWPETAAACEHVCVRPRTFALFLRAQAELWRRWVAISVTAWTGEHGAWPLKLAPFAIPPFRALLLNENGDFFGASPAAIAVHGGRRVHDAAYAAVNRTEDLLLLWKARIRGRTLWALATLLRWFGYPHRRWFAHLKGNERLALAAPAASGVGVARFTPAASAWDGKVFSEAVQSSRARWVLWSEEDTEVDLDLLLPFFADERTFAVALQDCYCAWTPGLLPTAPFRRLQAGESCRVLAPAARTMLVDRRKLAALGIPDCSLAGTTWLLLFWKAAAAGWISYSVGQDAAPTRRPDRPAEETAFFLHLLANARIRALGPADADLSRGTISTSIVSPAPRRFASHAPVPKVLVVSPFLPYPLSHGGAVRIYNLCRALQGKVEFALAAIREQNETVDYDRLHEVFSQVHVVDLDEVATADPDLPAQVRHYRSRSLQALVRHLAETWKPDLLQIEYTQMAAYRDAAPQVPAVLVEHDITFSLYRQLAASAGTADAQAEYERWRRFEPDWLRRFTGVWTVSGEDRLAAIAEGSAPDRTFDIPNGVDTSRYVPTAEPGGPIEVFYVGSFRHLPNVIGFDKLRREVMPRVWEKFPEAHLRVVAGPDYEAFWRRFANNGITRVIDRRITIHGFVEDLRPLYAAATVVVAPLEVSAGTNIKVLEAMASGRAVVSTPVGCAGLGLLDGYDARIAADWSAFADAVNELLAAPELRRALASEARRTVEARFSWTAIAEQAYGTYLMLAAPHHSNSSSDTPWRGSESVTGNALPVLESHLGESSIAS